MAAATFTNHFDYRGRSVVVHQTYNPGSAARLLFAKGTAKEAEKFAAMAGDTFDFENMDFRVRGENIGEEYHFSATFDVSHNRRMSRDMNLGAAFVRFGAMFGMRHPCADDDDEPGVWQQPDREGQPGTPDAGKKMPWTPQPSYVGDGIRFMGNFIAFLVDCIIAAAWAVVERAHRGWCRILQGDFAPA